MKILSEMTKKKYHDINDDDDYDCRIPLHPMDAFEEGLSFKVKCIGTLDVPRPTTRLEIVASMRRIRYEYKARNIKKKKVNMTVSTDGVKVVHKKKRRKRSTAYIKKDEKEHLLHDHPIYRIFYVTHDSQDMKIFSYIARDGKTNVFKCSVFKASKVSQAMRVVRTIGQAFEVCHQLDCGSPEEGGSTRDPLLRELLPYSSSQRPGSPLLAPLSMPPGAADAGSASDLIRSPLADPLGSGSALAGTTSGAAPLSSHHEWQLLQEQLDQQKDRTEAALAQVQLLKDQLRTEASARLEAQARTHQLLAHNRQLLAHVRALASQLAAEEDAELAALASSSSSSSSSSSEDVRQADADAGAGEVDSALDRMADALQRLGRGPWAAELAESEAEQPHLVSGQETPQPDQLQPQPPALETGM